MGISGSSSQSSDTNRPVFFLTPWQRGVDGKQARLNLQFNDADHTLTINKEKLSRINRILNVFYRTPRDKIETIPVRAFPNITYQTFLNEKQRLEELIKKKTSLEGLIKAIEQDMLQALTPPTAKPLPPTSIPEKPTPPSKPLPPTPQQPVLSEAELQHRRATLASLRQELAKLEDEIELQRPLTDQSGLHDSIENVKNAVRKVFDSLALIEDVIANTDSDAASVFQSLEMDPPTLPLALQVEEIRKTAIEEKQLEIEAEKFHATADILPDPIWEEWNTFYQNWKAGSASLKPGIAGIKARSAALRKAISDISKKYRDQVTTTLKAGIDSFIEQTGAIDTAKDNGKLKAASLNEFKNLLISARTASWQALINQCAEEPIDFSRIKSIESQIAELKGADEQAIELFKPTPRGIVRWLWELPSKFIFGDQEDPLSVLDSANRLFADRINGILISLRESAAFIVKTLYKDESVVVKGDDLARFLMNASHDMEVRQTDPSIRLEIEERIRKIKGFKLLLPDLLQAHRQLFKAFAENQRNIFQEMLKDSGNGQIRSAATAAINAIQDLSSNYPDLAAYDKNHPEIKNIATERMALLQSLESASTIYSHYNDNAKILETRLSTLTGSEKKLGEEALGRFREALESIQEIGETPVPLAERDPDFLLYTLPHAYNNLMIRAQSGVEAILDTEAKKIEIRDAIKREVKAYADHVDQMLADFDQIEKRLNITLDQTRKDIQASHKTVVQKETKCIVKPSASRIPLLDRMRGVQFEPLSMDASEGTNVDDLSVADLESYLKHIRDETAKEKDRIENLTDIARLKHFLQEFDTVQKQANGRISELTSGLRERGNENLRLQKLQFYNASLLSRGIKNIQEQLDQLSKLNPAAWEAAKAEESQKTYLGQLVPGAILDNLGELTGFNTRRFVVFLSRQLQNHKRAIDDLLVRSERMESITLLDQINRLGDDPSFQLQAKKAMLTLMEAKIKRHAMDAETLLNNLKTYGDLHKHAVGIVDDALISLDKNLKLSPLRGHVMAQFKSDNKQLGSLPPMPKIETLTYEQIRGYEFYVNDALNKLQGDLTHLENAYDRARKSEEIFSKKLQEAKRKHKQLDIDDQILSRNRMADVIKELEKNRADIANEDEERSIGIIAQISVLGRILEFTKHSKVAGALTRFTEEMSDGTAHLEKVLREIEKSKPMPLVKQLEITSSYSPVFTELRERLLTNTERQLQLTETELSNYSSLVSALPTEFFPINNYLARTIDSEIQKKRIEIGRLRHTQITSYRIVDSLLQLLPFGFGSLMSTRRSVASLSKYDLIQYQHDIDKVSKAAEDMEQMYSVNAFTEAYKDYDGLLKAISRVVDKYKSEGRFYTAYRLAIKIDEYKYQVESKWKDRVNNKADFETLKNELKAYCVLLRASAEDARREVSLSAPPLETQLNLLHAYRARGGVDREMLERYIEDNIDYISTKVESSHAAYVKEMKALVGDERKGKGTGGEIEKICTIFNISGHLKNKALNAVLIDLNNVSSSGVPTFETSESKLFPNRKTVKEMTLEEIVRVRPSEKVAAASKATMNKLSEAFNFKALSSSYKAYSSAIEAAKKAQSNLLSDGQVLFSTELGETIENLKGEYDDFLSSLQNESNVDQIVSRLDSIARQIVLAEKYQTSRQSLTAAEQALNLSPDSSHTELMAEALCIDLRKQADLKGAFIKLQKTNLQQLYDALNMPEQWKKMLSDEIGKNEKLLDEALKPQKINGKMVAIESMTIDQLLVVDAKVKSITSDIDAAFRRINVNKVVDQYNAYGRQCKKADDQRKIWLANSREDAVTRLDATLRVGRENLQDFLLKPMDPDLQTNMSNLAKQLHIVTQDLANDIFQIIDSMPKTFCEMLRAALDAQGNIIHPIEYRKVKTALKNSIDSRIKNQRDLIEEDLKKLQSIETRLNNLAQDEILSWKSTSPNMWMRTAEDFMNDQLQQLEQYSTGLRVMDAGGNIKFIPFDDLSLDQLEQYEAFINKFVETIGGKKGERGEQLKKIKERTDFASINKELETFQQYYSTIESFDSKADKTEKKLFKATLNSYVSLLSSVLDDMAVLESGLTLETILKQANGVLYQTIRYHQSNIVPPKTPWVDLKLNTDADDVFKIKDNVNTIIDDGFDIGELINGRFSLRSHTPSLKTTLTEIAKTIQAKRDKAMVLLATPPFNQGGPDEIPVLLYIEALENTVNEVSQLAHLMQEQKGLPDEKKILSFDQLKDLQQQIFNLQNNVKARVNIFEDKYGPILKEIKVDKPVPPPGVAAPMPGAHEPDLNISVEAAASDIKEDFKNRTQGVENALNDISQLNNVFSQLTGNSLPEVWSENLKGYHHDLMIMLKTVQYGLYPKKADAQLEMMDQLKAEELSEVRNFARTFASRFENTTGLSSLNTLMGEFASSIKRLENINFIIGKQNIERIQAGKKKLREPVSEEQLEMLNVCITLHKRLVTDSVQRMGSIESSLLARQALAWSTKYLSQLEEKLMRAEEVLFDPRVDFFFPLTQHLHDSFEAYYEAIRSACAGNDQLQHDLEFANGQLLLLQTKIEQVIAKIDSPEFHPDDLDQLVGLIFESFAQLNGFANHAHGTLRHIDPYRSEAEQYQLYQLALPSINGRLRELVRTTAPAPLQKVEERPIVKRADIRETRMGAQRDALQSIDVVKNLYNGISDGKDLPQDWVQKVLAYSMTRPPVEHAEGVPSRFETYTGLSALADLMKQYSSVVKDLETSPLSEGDRQIVNGYLDAHKKVVTDTIDRMQSIESSYLARQTLAWSLELLTQISIDINKGKPLQFDLFKGFAEPYIQHLRKSFATYYNAIVNSGSIDRKELQDWIDHMTEPMHQLNALCDALNQQNRSPDLQTVQAFYTSLAVVRGDFNNIFTELETFAEKVHQAKRALNPLTSEAEQDDLYTSKIPAINLYTQQKVAQAIVEDLPPIIKSVNDDLLSIHPGAGVAPIWLNRIEDMIAKGGRSAQMVALVLQNQKTGMNEFAQQVKNFVKAYKKIQETGDLTLHQYAMDCKKLIHNHLDIKYLDDFILALFCIQWANSSLSQALEAHRHQLPVDMDNRNRFNQVVLMFCDESLTLAEHKIEQQRREAAGYGITLDDIDDRIEELKTMKSRLMLLAKDESFERPTNTPSRETGLADYYFAEVEELQNSILRKSLLLRRKIREF